jgi:RsiW-degrading membrane proteinase PrsW (M82 family)
MRVVRWTHEPGKVARVCAGFFALLIATGLLVQQSGLYDAIPTEEEELADLIEVGAWDQATQIFQDVLGDCSQGPEDLIFFTESAGHQWYGHDAAKVLALLEKHSLSEILTPLWLVCSNPPGNPEDPDVALRTLAQQEIPPRYANFALGYWLFQHEHWKPAAEAFAREVLLHEDAYSREWVIHCHYQADDYKNLEVLFSLPEYRPFFHPTLLREMALQRKDWPRVFLWLVPAEYSDPVPWALALGALTACIWSAICLQMALTPSWRGGDLILYVTAFLLGAISTWPTLFWGMWSESELGWNEPSDTMGLALYCIVNIGLPEETLKLLLYLPLIPWVLKQNRPLNTLMVPAFVGLGFACEENIVYLQESDSLTAVVRFIESNFLHLSATGLAGFALTRVFQRGRPSWDEFFYAFGGVILAHGIYDAFVMSEELVEYFFVAPACLVLLAHYYFSELSHLRGSVNQPFSLTATFALGLTLLAGISFHFLLPDYEAGEAFRALGTSLLSSGPLIYMFVREMHEL